MSDEPLKSKRTVSPDGELLLDLIDGVKIREIRNIPSRVGITTEIYDHAWDMRQPAIQHMSHVLMRPDAVSQWNLHEQQDDYVFCTQGMIRFGLYDDREGSPTRGKSNIFTLTPMRPMLMMIPRHVWHAVRNVGEGYAAFVNFIDNVYNHDEPDEWRLPTETDRIPIRL